ncbi:hypothetical protein NX059_000270 [Plenodomus lindquistii]|nr:hypothetical protein NX059_000270 [Plenodomus lindquistii]
MSHPMRPPTAGTARHSRGHSTAPPTPGARKPVSRSPNLSQTYESRRGSHVVLEFADPTNRDQPGPSTPIGNTGIPLRPRHFRAASHTQTASGGPTTITSVHSRTSSEPPRKMDIVPPPTPGGSQTRLQATFEAIKRMSSSMASPRFDYAPRKTSQSTSAGEGAKDPGYFDVALTEGVET